MTTIEWTDVPGWRCQVSRAGQVKGPSGRILKPYVSKDGYHHVLIANRKLRVHHAVLLAFVGPRPDGQECRHLDDDPANNSIENLCWGTRGENLADQVRLGRRRSGEQKPNHRLTAIDVHAIRDDRRPSRIIGAAYGVSHTAILRIRRGERWAAA